MRRPVGGDLRQVRNAQHLEVRPQFPEARADDVGDGDLREERRVEVLLHLGIVEAVAVQLAEEKRELRASRRVRDDDVAFAFDPKETKLVTVTTLRNQLDASSAADALNTIAAQLKDELGEGRVLGTPSAEYLAEGAMRTALIEYRFSDYIANVSATNLGQRVAVREHYMSAID